MNKSCPRAFNIPPSMVDLDTLLALRCVIVLLQTCDRKLSTDFSKRTKHTRRKSRAKAAKKSNFSGMHSSALGGNLTRTFSSVSSGRRSVHLQASVIKAMTTPQGGNCTTSE